MTRKILLSLLVIVALFTITGCQNKEDGNDKDNINQKENVQLAENEYSLSINKSIIINQNLSITLVSVNDSRCPKDVECYWQGELAYSLLINEKNYTLSTVLNPKIDYQNYLISIVSDKCDVDNIVFKVVSK